MELGLDLNQVLEKIKEVLVVLIRKIIEIGKKISKVPENFNIHKTLKKIFDLRLKL